MTRNEFAARLAQGPLLLDGATGSNLMKAGMPKGVCAETWILDHPQAILDLQRAYVAAGSQVLLAPTFTAGRIYLSQHGLEGELKELNRRLVALSREAAQGKAWVAGDMTTMGRADVPYETMLEYYHEQAQALAEAGVDLILCETLMGHDEAMAALEGCRMAAAELPVCCSFSVTADGMLYFGGSVYEAAPQVAEFGADAVGINCSVGPDQLESVVRALRESLTVSVIAKPNAGMPEIDDQGNAHYSMHAADFGRHMAALHRAGASILGGCCGTEPPYIAALKAAL
ncbi:MAG TPA: homocysteine S-methyltransferase family protein [Candidatus Avoscillospira stercorigallinarum]|uniref:Homocysteine S-methyltransferase family protein n=1 Tax=Candidatus Avoscillospira stercorigallinarum TaxID=2840708 RepID=A0A9D0Z4Z8_9FIRM|nr:homocysteine S-methyltransferase family protein [Candidatus Avoscillospira stercorigallinarum]